MRVYLYADTRHYMRRMLVTTVDHGEHWEALGWRWTLVRSAALDETSVMTIKHDSFGKATAQEKSLALDEPLMRWRTTPDDQTCNECAALDGRTFRVGELPLPPRHEGCRCTVEHLEGEGKGDG